MPIIAPIGISPLPMSHVELASDCPERSVGKKMAVLPKGNGELYVSSDIISLIMGILVEAVGAVFVGGLLFCIIIGPISKIIKDKFIQKRTHEECRKIRDELSKLEQQLKNLLVTCPYCHIYMERVTKSYSNLATRERFVTHRYAHGDWEEPYMQFGLQKTTRIYYVCPNCNETNYFDTEEYTNWIESRPDIIKH